MNKEIDSRWLKKPDIQIQDRFLMTVNGNIVSLPDTTYAIFSDYLEIAQAEISDTFQQFKTEQRWGAHRGIKPTIILGRLALNPKDESVLTAVGLNKEINEEIDLIHLQAEYRQYWLAVEHSLYKPQIRRGLEPDRPGALGLWLGLSRP